MIKDFRQWRQEVTKVQKLQVSGATTFDSQSTTSLVTAKTHGSIQQAGAGMANGGGNRRNQLLQGGRKQNEIEGDKENGGMQRQGASLMSLASDRKQVKFSINMPTTQGRTAKQKQ